jgi:hypothetical protein
MKAPSKVAVQVGDHIVEGDVEMTHLGSGEYTIRLTNGQLMCGPHDEQGNHVEVVVPEIVH